MDRFIIKTPNSNIRIEFKFISEYELLDGSIFQYNNKMVNDSNHFMDHTFKHLSRNLPLLKRVTIKQSRLSPNRTYINHIVKHTKLQDTTPWGDCCDIFILHSEIKPAREIVTIDPDNNVIEHKEKYFIDGKKIDKTEWNRYNRERKLKRILEDEVD